MAETSSTDYEKTLKDADNEVASFEEGKRRGLVGHIQHWLHVMPSAVPLIVLVVSIGVFGLLLGSKFFSPFALTLILQQVWIVGMVGAAQTLVILTAGIDLSVGAVMVLSSVVMGQCVFRYGFPAEIAVVAGLMVGALCGYINGILVAYVKLPPFIVTLGMWQIILASNFLYSANETVRSQDIAEHAPLLQFFGEKIQLGSAVFTYGVIALVLLIFLLNYLLNHTAWGRHVYAIGDDPEAAELSGVRVKRTLVLRVCHCRSDLRHCRLDACRPHRLHFPHRRTISEHRIDHCGGYWRHIAVWRARFYFGHVFRRVNRRRIFSRFKTARQRSAVDLSVDRCAHHLSRRDRQLDQKGSLMTEPLLSVRNLVKRYGRVTALDHADFDLLPNEILGVIGDNGAGKSTLIKAISGAVRPDSGTITLAGQEVSFHSPMDAKLAGIETVYQNLALSPSLSIADNMFMGREIRKSGLLGKYFRKLDRRQMEKIAREKLSELGLLTIQNINQAVETLSGGQRPGRRGGTGGCVWFQINHHGRTHSRAWRQGIQTRA